MQTLQKLYQLTDQRLSKQKLKGKLKICSWVFLALIKMFFSLPLVLPIRALFAFKEWWFRMGFVERNQNKE